MPEPCECPARKALDELYHLLQHLEDQPNPKFILTHSHNERIRAALSAPCPCDQLRADLAEALDILRAVEYEPLAKASLTLSLAALQFERAAAVLAKHPEVKA